jgi:hypothetical protein
MVFTQRNTFGELVNSAEGVPRDALNVIALTAQGMGNDAISVAQIRTAGKTWYQRDNETAAGANPDARALLHWVVYI